MALRQINNSSESRAYRDKIALEIEALISFIAERYGYTNIPSLEQIYKYDEGDLVKSLYGIFQGDPIEDEPFFKLAGIIMSENQNQVYTIERIKKLKEEIVTAMYSYMARELQQTEPSREALTFLQKLEDKYKEIGLNFKQLSNTDKKILYKHANGLFMNQSELKSVLRRVHYVGEADTRNDDDVKMLVKQFRECAAQIQ